MRIYSINVNVVIKKIFYKFSVLAFILASCSTNENIEKDKIIHEMQQQEVAWNNGSLEKFMQGYVHSDSLVFIGKSGLKYGWKTTLENYKKSYPDIKTMGKLKFKNIKIDILNNEHAYVVGKWDLFRQTDTIGGYYSLLWKKIKGKWFIISDHSS